MAPPLIQATALRKDHRLGDAIVPALRGVTLTIEAGEFVAIMGPSGSGKSSLLHLLGLLDRPTAGGYRLAGRAVADLCPDNRAQIRAQGIGFIFQAFNLLGRNTAIENVELAMTYAGIPRTERRRRAETALTQIGLGERQHHWPGQLSGGEQQRVAIARVLAAGPRLILADEPTGALDTATGREIMALLQDMNRAGRTIVLVTHDPAVAAYAQRIVRMQDGRIVSDLPAAIDRGAMSMIPQAIACPETTAS
ncbi:ABC transporter ATP-binding protein [Microvirga pakistanensis]|uniref:ABC transporter ATP-binding protein n=1 Tax=Microvirga pakistanensis TaxID=1682650 RepID=UPI0010699410|nr:ABC transporter ATP-binding protein [Microvirga pakistanensis]